MTHYLPGPRPDDLPISAAVWDAAKRDGKQSDAVAVALYEAVKELEQEAQQIRRPPSVEEGIDPSRVWLKRSDLAARWQLSAVTLGQWATRGEGPKVHKFGKHVRYSPVEVEEWENARDGGGKA